MTENDTPDLVDVMVPTEHVSPDHHEHAKTPKHVDDDELAERTEHEREATHADRGGDAG
jgi:hypothetical protein